MKKLVFPLVLILMSFTTNDRPEHELHAMMVYNFIKYIQWPTTSEEFTIAVVGDENVYSTLNEWYGGKLRGGKKFRVLKFSGLHDFKECEILYLGKGARDKFRSLKNKIKNSPTLLVTNKAGFAEQGSAINFKTVGNKLRFELNQKVMDAANLKVSSQLTAMAILL